MVNLDFISIIVNLTLLLRRTVTFYYLLSNLKINWLEPDDLLL